MFIGDLLLRAGLDLTQFQRDRSQLESQIAAVPQRLQSALGNVNILPNMAGQGARVAEQLVTGLKTTLEARTATLSSQLAEKIISPEQFSRRAGFAAAQFNQKLLAGIGELRSRNLLPPGVEARLVSQLSAAGTAAGGQTAKTIAQGIRAFQPEVARAIEQALTDAVRQARAAVVREVSEMMQTVGQRMQSIGRTLSFAVTAPLVAFGGFAIKASAGLQKLRLGLVAITGSSEEAAAQLGRLEQIAKLPGIGFEEALKGSSALQAVGFSAALAERSLKAFANTIALTGGGRAELERVNIQLAQMASAGKILTQDLRPLIQTAPALGMALKTAFGTVNAAEIEALGLSVEDFFDRLLTAQEAMARAPGGVANSFDNLADSIKRARAAIGDAMLPVVVELTDKFSTWLERVRNTDRGLINLGISAAVFAAVLGPLALLIGGVTIAVGAFVAATSVMATVLTGGAIVVLGLLAAAWVKNKLEVSQAAAAVQAYNEKLGALRGDAAAHELGAVLLKIQGINEELAKLPATVRMPEMRELGASGDMGSFMVTRANPRIAELQKELALLLEQERVLARANSAGLASPAQNNLANEAARLAAAQDALDAEQKARSALADQIDLLNDARDLGIDRVGTLRELFRLERQLSAEIERGTGSLDRRVFIAQQLAKIPTFEAGTAALAIPQLGVSIGAVVIANPDEARQRYREAVAAALARAAVTATLNLKLRTEATTPQQRVGGAIQAAGLNETIQAVQQVTSGFDAMADALGNTSEELSSALRAVDSFSNGIALLKSDQAKAGGLAGALTQVSGVLGIAASVVSFVDTIRQQEARVREAIKAVQRSLEDWANALFPGTALQQATRDAKRQFEQMVLGIADAFNADFLKRPENLNPDTANLALIRELAALDIPNWTFDDAARAYLEAIRLYNEATKQAEDSIRAFAKTLEGARAERELGNKLRGIELDPTQEISGILNDLKNTFPALFEQIFAGVNLTDTSAIRQAAVRFFETMSALSGPALEAFLGGTPVDEVLGWLGVFGDALNSATKAAQSTASALLGVPEVFNFTLASLRAAGTREFLPQAGGPSRFGPDRDPRTPSQDNRVTTGDIIVQAPGTSLEDITAAFERAIGPLVAKAGGKVSIGETVTEFKAELTRRALSKGPGTRELALNWPG